LGKLLFGIRVVQTWDGGRLSYGRALGRHISHVVLTCLPFLGEVSNLACLWDKPLRQCFHDKIADTVVVRNQRL
jgi:uncharacterized RDD family membrane protein YckC